MLINSYIDKMSLSTIDKLSLFVNLNTIQNIGDTVFTSYIADERFLNSHEYYLQITGKTDKIIEQVNFFGDFKSRYSLQGIDNNYLTFLESKKSILIDTTIQDPFSAYSNYFFKASLLQKGKTVYKSLASFFSKFTHTCLPSEYCALDNPIKNYFDLDRESFFVAYCIINDSYQKWLLQNQITMEQLRRFIMNIDSENKLQIGYLTDIKLLDLIFWFKANKG